MALVLTMKLGQEAIIGTRTMKIAKIKGPAQFTVSFEGADYDLTPDAWVPIADGVQVRASFPKSSDRMRVRVQINAPMYTVLRSSLLAETEGD